MRPAEPRARLLRHAVARRVVDLLHVRADAQLEGPEALELLEAAAAQRRPAEPGLYVGVRIAGNRINRPSFDQG